MTHDILMQETIMFVCVAALTAFVVWLFFRRKQNAAQLEHHRLEILNRMIDKFGSGPEFVAYLQTDQGKRLFQEPNGQSTDAQGTGKVAILRYIQVGVMLFVLGVSFMTQAEYGGPDAAYWGITCFMLAIGLWIVATITYVWNRLQDRANRRLAPIEAGQH